VVDAVSSGVALAEERWCIQTSDGVDYRVAHFFNNPDRSKPQVFYVTYARPEADTTRVHFHSVPQFQLFMEGRGSVSRHQLEGLWVHYADPFTPYGPIVDQGGFSYFTIRARRDPGAFYMPESRHVLQDHRGTGPHRNITARVADHLAGPDAVATSADVIPPEPDGVRASHWRVPAGQAWRGSAGGDAMAVVLRGQMAVGDCVLPALSFVSTPAGEATADVWSIVDSELLVLRFPTVDEE
jgi:hypothetical protein